MAGAAGRLRKKGREGKGEEAGSSFSLVETAVATEEKRKRKKEG